MDPLNKDPVIRHQTNAAFGPFGDHPRRQGGLAGAALGKDQQAEITDGDGHAMTVFVLTGGLAKSERVVAEIRGRVAFLAPVMVYPGENELEALALGVLAVLRGEAASRVYEG